MERSKAISATRVTIPKWLIETEDLKKGQSEENPGVKQNAHTRVGERKNEKNLRCHLFRDP